MIDLTVKTLDSQNHSFSLDDDQITVRGFKEYIAESVAVPADSQRLIYCGRVLQDEKKLNDYDVNGKVIHLVQRAPPQPGQRGNRSGQNQGQTNPLTWQNPQRAHYRLTRAQTHGNTMYVGGMPTPTEVMEGHSVPLPQMVSSFPFRRLSTITRMFDRLNELISYLHDPACPLNNTPSENNQASSGTQESAQEPERERQQGEQMPSMPTSSPWSDDEEDNVTEAQSGSAQAENQTGTQPPQQEQQSDQRSTPTADAQGNRRSVPLLAHAPLAATMLEILVSTINRLRPFMRAYCRLLQADPVLQPGPGPNGIEENQRLVNTVSESLHYLAHACHALSDIIVDLSQPPPRILNSTQTIVQHSAILQHGIPIQVEAYFSVHRRNANNNNGNEESDEDADATTAPESTESTAQDATPQNQTETQPTNQPAPDQPQAQTQSRFGPVLNLSNNLEVLMEVTPEINVYIPSGSDQTQTGETNNNNNNAGRRNAAGIYPWGSTGSPDFLRSFIQTVVGQVAQEGIATTTISTRTSASTTTAQRPVATSVDSGNTNSGQSTQARSNVGTHPTTATQTRSTSRPHIIYQHAHPLGIEMVFGQGFDFDPFLPCNSHHRRRAPNQVGMGGTPPPEETETNETAASESEAQPQTAAASSAANTSSENTTAPSAPPAGTFINLIQQILERVTNQPQVNIGISSNNSNLAENLGDFLQMYSGGNIHVGIIGDRGGNSIGQQIQQTVSDRLGIEEFAADLFRSRPNFLVSLSIMMIDNMTPEGWYRLASGDSEPIAQLRRPLQEFLQSHFHSASLEVIQRQTIILLLLRIGPYLHRLLVIAKNHIGPSGARVNIRATVEALFTRHIKDMLSNLFNSEIDDARFGQEVINSMNNLGRQLCIVIQYAFRGGVSGLDELLSHSWFPPLERGSPGPWIIRRFFSYLRTYSSNIPQPPESEIQPLLVYQDTPSEASSAPSAPVQQTPQTQAEVEPKEMEVVEERTTFESCFADNEENIPETFPGHEVLPSDWVPIIARDTVRQRRQLEMQAVLNEGVTTFSDAYLGVLPTKRRKIIEQQKSRLLVSPTPTQSAIAASLERLVRENINRAGVEEVDGAALAVASNPAVRRNFGGAIRDYLNPRRQGTSDFPDLLRFPNASKYFSEQEKPPK